MIKFDIIESPEKFFKNQIIIRMRNNVKDYLNNEIFSGEPREIIFVAVEEKEKKFRGAVCLFKRALNTIQEDVRELVMTLPLQGHVWECSNIYLEDFSKNLESEQMNRRKFPHSFYRGLYQGLAEFGKQKNVGFVIMKLFPEVYTDTKQRGLWPYVVELKPENSPDGLFHGILPLTGSQYRAYQKIVVSH